MAWALLDDNFPFHPKVLEANRCHALAGYLFVCGLCYCRKYRTSGFIPHAAMKMLGLSSGYKKPADALVASRLWDDADGGYQVHGYLEQYDDAEEIKAKDERRRQKQEAGRKGGKASWLKRNTDSASSAAEAPASVSAEAHRNGLVRSGSIEVLPKKEKSPNRDQWLLELWTAYPSNRRSRSKITSDLFNDQFDKDPRVDEQIWSDMWQGLLSQKAGYEWRVKGMVHSMDKWLEKELWRNRHEAAPVSTQVSDKTARTLSSLAEFVKDGTR